MRRVLIIVGALVAVIAIAALVYFFFFAGKDGSVTATPGGQFPGGDPFAGGNEAPDVGAAQEAGNEVAPHLIRITEGPVAHGAVALAKTEIIVVEVAGASTTATSTRELPVTEIRYVERASGNVYAYKLNERTLTRLSNRTVPGVQEASWVPDGSMALVRYLGEGEEIETYAMRADGGEGYPLERDLSQAFVSGSSTVVTLLSGTNGSIATAARADGTNAKTLFTSLLASLRAYPSNAGYFVATKASAQADGYAFRVRGTSLERVLGPLKGLTVLPSPSGAFVLYTYLSGNTVRSALYEMSTHTATILPVTAMPEKCAWSANEDALYCGIPRIAPTSEWPDSWYQGVTHFTDRIWRIDLEGRTASLVVDPKLVANVEIDAVALTIDTESDALVFTNKSDGSLWVYDL